MAVKLSGQSTKTSTVNNTCTQNYCSTSPAIKQGDYVINPKNETRELYNKPKHLLTLSIRG